MAGFLLVVATPIGNLEDLGPRVKEAFAQVDAVLAEDTRRTRNLLSHLGVKKPLESFHQHNQEQKIPLMLEWLSAGKKLALATDAGTPAVSDPGAKLIRAALELGIKVIPIPGPSAITTALSVSGFPSDRFLFLGFLPARPAARKKMLEQYRDFPETVVLFEAPHRVRKTVADLEEIWGDRKVCLCRELTKLHEQIEFTDLAGLRRQLEQTEPRGEITLVIAGKESDSSTHPQNLEPDLEELIAAMIAEGKTIKQIISELESATNLPKNLIYKKALEIKKRLDRGT